ncbi:hypothetical protein FQZ97_1237100 [compost metagenome]
MASGHRRAMLVALSSAGLRVRVTILAMHDSPGLDARTGRAHWLASRIKIVPGRRGAKPGNR